MSKTRNTILVVFIPLIFLCAVAYFLPPIRSRVDWRVEQLRLQIKYALFPPEQAVFVPNNQQDQVAAAVQATFKALTPAATATPTITPTWTPGPTQPPTLTPTPTPTATPLPVVVDIKGVRYVDQHGALNYCAPANLAMALSYWGWKGTRADTGKGLKPFDKDLNVMPYEMVDYVLENTEYKALWRSGGDLPLIKKLLASGYPVVIEKGTYMPDRSGKISWMGHYEVFTGYVDTQSQFIVQDSYFNANMRVGYEEVEKEWRSFNKVFILVYSADKEAEVNALLGPYADEASADRLALDKSAEEIKSLTGVDQYFAYYNRGTSLVRLQDFGGAAAAYDYAFKLYESLPKDNRPWRMLWYQTGPYFAYYYTGRYQDLVNLATLTITTAAEPFLEESFYWRGLGYIAIGKPADATQDFKTALEYHPGFQPALQQLQKLGVNP